MSTRLLEVIEVANPTDKLRCYITGSRDGRRTVKARLLRGGQLIEENVFFFDARLSLRDLIALLENAMREIAAAAGGKFRILTEVNRGA